MDPSDLRRTILFFSVTSWRKEFLSLAKLSSRNRRHQQDWSIDKLKRAHLQSIRHPDALGKVARQRQLDAVVLAEGEAVVLPVLVQVQRQGVVLVVEVVVRRKKNQESRIRVNDEDEEVRNGPRNHT